MSETNPDVIAALVEHHRRFLAFLERRVDTPDQAEEILQAAFVRGVESGGAIQHEDSAVAWFYRLLRNALVDHYRRRDAEARALERERTAAVAPEPPDGELDRVICACLRELIPTLKAEYADILTRVELGEQPIAEYARETKMTANNARVRLHRARQALRKQLERMCGTCTQHGCLDCHCESAPRVWANSAGCNATAPGTSAGMEDSHDP